MRTEEKIEMYIREHREEFDSCELPQGSFGRLLEKVEAASGQLPSCRTAAGNQNSAKGGALAERGRRAGIFTDREKLKRLRRFGIGAFAALGSVAAAALLILFPAHRGGMTGGGADYVERLCSLQQEICELGEGCRESVAKEAMLTSKTVLKETIPLICELPEELPDRQKERILRRCYARQTEALLRIRDCLSLEAGRGGAEDGSDFEQKELCGVTEL